MIYARRAVVFCLVAALGALGASGCGARTEVDDPLPALSCPPEQPSSDTGENCHRYCNVYRCLACPDTATRCEEACLALAGDPLTPQGNPTFGQCLACAVKHVSRLAPHLDCTNDLGPGGAGQATFSTIYPIDQCPECSP